MKAINFIKSRILRRQFISADQFLQRKAEELSTKVFVGGPLKDFENNGRLQMITLLKIGLYPHSKVLDVGCGCLRAGYWLIHFLNKGCYAGIEPNREMLDAGIDVLLSRQVVEAKQPRFDDNQDFDFSVFNERFDFVLARSIWTHASKGQIERMLDSFVDSSKDTGVFLTSYKRAGLLHPDYLGESWVGKSHESDDAGTVAHDLSWVQQQCASRGLKAKELPFDVYNTQVWLHISKQEVTCAAGGR